ncbi:DUF1569 domain-containing protein [Stieleria sedimenti]|uniref:DUF1569 domain-containing protein n=1 Tax=Stieleria sedimenti TaxID=2976331 RepID=UPI002B221396|nr:DUF1569 domain-containing protein [Stieleria sedimenti]
MSRQDYSLIRAAGQSGRCCRSGRICCQCRASVNHSGNFAPHPAFGRLPRDRILEIHAAHAAHHLRQLRCRDETS